MVVVIMIEMFCIITGNIVLCEGFVKSFMIDLTSLHSHCTKKYRSDVFFLYNKDMHVEVDQSNKIEQSGPTVLAFANGNSSAIVIPSIVKNECLDFLLSS